MRARDLLLMGAGAGSGWAHPSAVRALDFRKNRYTRQGVQYALPDLASVTRAGTGWLDSIGGIWSEFLAGVLRRTDRGAAIGERYTSKIQNPRGNGGTIGVIGSGGALPTNMAVEQAMAGVATSFLGTGTAPNGKPCFYIGLNGTLSGANSLIIRLEGATYATAAAGQAWGLDFDSYLSGGTAAGLASVKARIRDNAAVMVAESSENGLTGGATRLVAKGVVSGGATSIYPRLVVNSLNDGATVNAVLCICSPKLVRIAAVEGPELITNGDFLSAAGWTIGSGWSVAGGKANKVAGPNSSIFSSFAPPTAGAVLKASLVVSSYVDGGVALFLSTSPAAFGPVRTANGTFTDYFVLTGAQNMFGVNGNPNSNLSVDDMSLREIVAGYMPAFPILPALGVIADSTKQADDVAATNLDWFAAAGLNAGMAQLAAFELTHVSDGAVRYLFEYSDDTLDNRLAAYIGTDNKPVLKIVVGGVTLATVTHPTALAVGRRALVFGWGPAGLYITNGAMAETQAAVALPTVTRYRLGGGVSAVGYFNDVIEQEQQCRPLTVAAANALALSAAA